MKDKIIKRGFELLVTRPPEEKLDLSSVQQEHNIKLPPLYKSFVEMFKVGESRNNVEYRQSNGVTQYCAGVFYLQNDSIREDVMFDEFLTAESTISSCDADDDWLENGYLAVATCAHGGSILVGIQEENLDQILLQDNTQEFHHLNSNIFDFVRSLVLLSVPENSLVDGITFDQLYKKWGENFWRVKF